MKRLYILFAAVVVALSLKGQGVYPVVAQPLSLAVRPIDATFTGYTNTTKTALVYTSTDGTNAFCGYSNKAMPDSTQGNPAANIYTFYGGFDWSYTLIGLSTSVLSTCETTFNVKYGVTVQQNGLNFEYRIISDAGGFSWTGVLAQDNDQFGLFRATDGTVEAMYYRTGSWHAAYTFPHKTRAKLYPSFTGILSDKKLDQPKFSSNIQ